jgi:hypothetical protein
LCVFQCSIRILKISCSPSILDNLYIYATRGQIALVDKD